MQEAGWPSVKFTGLLTPGDLGSLGNEEMHGGKSGGCWW